MIDPLSWIDAEADAWAHRGLRRRLEPLRRTLINFASNDYLGLANDPRVIEAARASAEVHGWGAGASPLVSGWREPHEALAAALARFEGAEAVALFGSGYAANLGTIAALVGKGDAVYLDRLDHACLVDGARLSGASLRVYPHVDMDRLEATLDRDRGRYRRSLIATDGVFSMDGDVAPVAALADLARRFGAMLLVDEAHGTGVFGPTGRGASEGVAVDIKVGTLSKALGSVGGFVAGSRRLVDWLTNHARPLVYSTAPPPAAASAALKALEIAGVEGWRRDHLAGLAGMLRGSLGLPPGGPIVPLIIGDPSKTLELSARLREGGLLVPAIRPPTVPAGTSRLRISLTAAHTREDVERLISNLNNFRFQEENTHDAS